MVKRGTKKFCPRCGAQNNINDAYCIRCGYSFRGKKKSSSKTILILIIIFLIAWILLRIYLNKSIIPTELIDIIKNITSNKTK
jgi:ribosomal protein L40E